MMMIIVLMILAREIQLYALLNFFESSIDSSVLGHNIVFMYM